MSSTHLAMPVRKRTQTRSRILAVALIGLGLGLVTAPTAMPVEVSHPVVDFLRRLEEKGLIEPGFWSTLPRDEAEVARVLEGAARQGARLGAWDRRRLEHYRDLFDPQRKRRSLLHYEDGSPFVLHGGVELAITGDLRDSLPRPDQHGFGSYGGKAQVAYDELLWALASVHVGSEHHLLNRFRAGYQYDPAMGMPYSVRRDGLNGSDTRISTFDAARAVLGVGNTHMKLEIGQDWNLWGPGRWQHATLGPRPHFWIADAPTARPGTDYDGTPFPGAYRRGYRYAGEGPPMPQVRLRLGSRNWEYTKVVGSRRGLWKDSLATLIAHRLQVRLGNVRLGATEMTMIGTRAPEAIYFLPGMPLRVAEHEASDRDNAMMSFDAEWVMRGYGRVYGELLIDDFSGPPLDYWGNKLAWTIGGAWQDPFGLPAELQCEFAHVDPWVYGHHKHNTQAQSFGSLLGSSLPPNSRAWHAALLFPLPAGIEGSLDAQVRQRDLKSPGSSLFDGLPSLVGDTDELKDFLARDVETRVAFEAGISWSWRRYVTLDAGLGTLRVHNFRGEPGADLTTATARGGVLFRY